MSTDTQAKPAETPRRIPPKCRKFTQDLMVRLGSGDLAKRGRELVLLQDRQQELRAEAKALVQQAKDMNEQASRLQETLRNGQEIQTVPCQQISDYERREVLTYRMDTVDQIECRPMVAGEMQPDLPLNDQPLPETLPGQQPSESVLAEAARELKETLAANGATLTITPAPATETATPATKEA